MSLEAILIIVFLAVLVTGWLVMSYRDNVKPPAKSRNSSDYRHQQTENPDYSPKGIGV